MIRITHGYTTKKYKKKILKLTKGYRGTASNLSTYAIEQLTQSYNYAYIGRKLKKRYFKTLWISRINITTKYFNIQYSFFLNILKKNNIFLNRKLLAYLAYNDLPSFKYLTNI
uniref:50S ribosomal protein L20 n=1 Tax=Spumella sp. NIES-1846 TaxID=2490549 RepID=A0A455RG03_9STRA|nr:ribosomal protein L20 [Spumella sp. NIES-1846]